MATRGETREARRAGSRTAMRVTRVPTAMVTTRDRGVMVSWSASRSSMTPERTRSAAAPAPSPAPRTEPITPVRAAVRSTAPMTWRRVAPMQRSRPVVRVWRATRAAKVVAMTMAATTAHTGASRFMTMVIMVPPDWEAAAR